MTLTDVSTIWKVRSHLQSQVICVTSVDTVKTLVVDVIGQLIRDVIGRISVEPRCNWP